MYVHSVCVQIIKPPRITIVSHNKIIHYEVKKISQIIFESDKIRSSIKSSSTDNIT